MSIIGKKKGTMLIKKYIRDMIFAFNSANLL